VVPKKDGDRDQRFHLDRRAGRLADEIESKGKADDLLTEGEFADSLGITRQRVWNIRVRNIGPPFVSPFPEVVRYRRGDAVKWLRARARLHAAEYA
jgi:hypothetical protein